MARNTKTALDRFTAVRYGFGMTRLKELRLKLGLSQERLAEMVGTSQPQIKRLESGERSMSRRWAERLAPVLGVQPAELVFDRARVPANDESVELAKLYDVLLSLPPEDVAYLRSVAERIAARLPPKK